MRDVMRDKRNQGLCYKSGLEALNKFRSIFPALEMELNEQDPNVDIMLTIPEQKGLDFTVYLNLQNIDELHLSVGDLWMCWFPCTDPENCEDYINTVKGLISGEYRILETLRGNKVVKAQLQIPMNGEWVSRSSGLMTFKLPAFKKKTFNVVQNTKSA